MCFNALSKGSMNFQFYQIDICLEYIIYQINFCKKKKKNGLYLDIDLKKEVVDFDSMQLKNIILCKAFLIIIYVISN